jgi:hypothetical protein
MLAVAFHSTAPTHQLAGGNLLVAMELGTAIDFLLF